MKENIQKRLYAILTSQTLSSNGKFLFVSSSFGEIASFNVHKIISCIENVSADYIPDPISIFKCPEKSIYSLKFHRDFLIVGGSLGVISGYSITDSGSINKRVWTIQVPLSPDAQEMNEINDMWLDENNLYAGLGDGNLYSFNLEYGSFIKKYTGHKDYIHSVHGYDQQVVTASEDGSAKFWDPREKEASFSIEPFKNPSIHRQHFGRWLGDAKLSSDWFVTGGASRLTLFHLRNRQPFHIFDFPKEIHVTDFIDGNLLAAGDSNKLITYSFKGTIVSEIETSGSAIYSVVWQKNADRHSNILTACGASNKIEVTTNFSFKDGTLNFYPKE